MEDVLQVYTQPYNKDFPVVCMDESSMQLIGEVNEPIPAASGHPELLDDEYVRRGVASIFLEVEPLGGKRKVKITERRIRIDWANFIKFKFLSCSRCCFIVQSEFLSKIPVNLPFEIITFF